MSDRLSPVRGLALILVVLVGCSGAGRPTLSEDTVPPLECSADGMTITEFAAEGVAPGVAATRQAIVDAAVDCDYEALLDLAAAGPVSVTLDGTDVPVADWERREAEGKPILRLVAGILTLVPATTATDGSVTWPSAVDWQFSDVAPGDERQALIDVVGETGIFGWEETGGYAGWRTAIAADGSWSSVTLGPAPG
jgi:hypothetical protein